MNLAYLKTMKILSWFKLDTDQLILKNQIKLTEKILSMIFNTLTFTKSDFNYFSNEFDGELSLIDTDDKFKYVIRDFIDNYGVNINVKNRISIGWKYQKKLLKYNFIKQILLKTSITILKLKDDQTTILFLDSKYNLPLEEIKKVMEIKKLKITKKSDDNDVQLIIRNREKELEIFIAKWEKMFKKKES